MVGTRICSYDCSRSPEGVINTHNYQAMYYDDGSYAGITKSSLTFKPWLDWYLETTGQRLVGGSGPLHQLQLVMAATPHLVHQMRAVMVATQLSRRCHIWIILILRLEKVGTTVSDLFAVILDCFTEFAHLPCSMPHILEVNPCLTKKKYSLLVLKEAFLTSLGRYAFLCL